jgi:hypothetical protein
VQSRRPQSDAGALGWVRRGNCLYLVATPCEEPKAGPGPPSAVPRQSVGVGNRSGQPLAPSYDLSYSTWGEEAYASRLVLLNN